MAHKMLERFYIGDVVAEDIGVVAVAAYKNEFALNPKKKIAFALEKKEQVRDQREGTSSMQRSNIFPLARHSFHTTPGSSRSRCRRPPPSSAFLPASTSSSAL